MIRKRVLFFLIVFLVAGSVRFLTFNLVRARLNDASWFQYGTYRIFDKLANGILDGSERMFWIDDPSRTDLMTFPPGYPWMVAAIYRLTGERSAYAVQRVQSVLDLFLSMILITGVAITAYGWHTGMVAIVLASLSPLLAFVGVSPLVDAPTAWFVIGGLWLLLIAAKRSSKWWAFGAAVVLGGACWLRVNPLYLCLFWAVPLLVFSPSKWRTRALMSGAIIAGTVLVVSPIIIRNYVVFQGFTLTGGGIGANLWEGLGETELGRSNGFMFGDEKLVERERIQMGLPPDFPIDAMWPDGIKRERARTREALAFIRRHAVWYVGVMFHRMWGLLKIAGAPMPYLGTAGINVTSPKCLPPALQGGLVAVMVNGLGMLQSLSRYALLPLAACGLWLGWRRERLMTVSFAATIFYYLVPGSIAHTEIRYALPLHWLLPIFAGLSLVTFGEWISKQRRVKTPCRRVGE